MHYHLLILRICHLSHIRELSFLKLVWWWIVNNLLGWHHKLLLLLISSVHHSLWDGILRVHYCRTRNKLTSNTNLRISHVHHIWGITRKDRLHVHLRHPFIRELLIHRISLLNWNLHIKLVQSTRILHLHLGLLHHLVLIGLHHKLLIRMHHHVWLLLVL